MLEKEIQNAILRQYATRPDMRLFRSATGKAVPMQEIRKVLEAICPHYAAAVVARLHPINFGTEGQADVNGILGPEFGSHHGRRVEIEIKQKDGRLSEAQKNWGAMMCRMGAIYVVARSVDDVGVALAPFMGGVRV